MPVDINRLVSEEVSWLARQEAPVANKLVGIYQDTFLEIEQKLSKIKDLGSYTANQLRATQAQLGALIDGMATQHSELLGDHVKSVYRKQLGKDGKTWARLEEAFGDPKLASQFKDITPAINQRAIRSLVTTQNISIKGFSSDLQRQVREVLAVSHARGETSSQMVSRLRSIKGLPACSPNRLRLIVRMETARSSNKAKVDHIKELQRQFPDKEFWLMCKDRLDRGKKTRNHWFSFAVSGTVRCVTRGEYYEVTTARLDETKAEYKKMTGKKASDNGVLWKPGGVGRRGKGLPAHFWDRGVEVAWSPEWKGAAFGAALHPQGPITPAEPVKPEEQPAEKSTQPTAEKEAPEISSGHNDHLKPAKQETSQTEKPKPSAKERIRKRRIEQIAFHQVGPDDELVTNSFDELYQVDDELVEIFDKLQTKDKLLNRAKTPKRGLWEFEKEIIDLLNHEEAMLFDEKGTVTVRRGGSDNVQFSHLDVYQNRCKRMTHNHWNGTSLSHADIINAIVANFKEIRVVTNVKGRRFLYSLSRNSGRYWTSETLKQDSGWKWSLKDARRIYDTYVAAYNERIQMLRATSNFDQDQRLILATDYATSVVAAELNADYIRMEIK